PLPLCCLNGRWIVETSAAELPLQLAVGVSAKVESAAAFAGANAAVNTVLTHMADTREDLPTTHTSPGGQGWQRGFWSLIFTQFQGAFSDNALKYLVLFLVIGAGVTQAQQERINNLAAVL